jgi:hypothetical protein
MAFEEVLLVKTIALLEKDSDPLEENSLCDSHSSLFLDRTLRIVLSVLQGFVGEGAVRSILEAVDTVALVVDIYRIPRMKVVLQDTQNSASFLEPALSQD